VIIKKNGYFKGGTMKNIIFTLLLSTTIFAQGSTLSLYEESQKALADGNLNLAKDKILAAIEADNTNQSYRDYYENKIRKLNTDIGNANRSISDKRFDDAITAFDKILNEAPNLSSALSGKGKAHYYKKEYEEAIIYFEKSLDIDPSYTKAKIDKSNAIKKFYLSIKEDHVDRGQYDIAISKYKQVLTYQPKFFQAYSQMGVINRRNGSLSLAIENFESALAINKNQPKILFQLGKTHKDNGNLESSKEAYEKAVKLDEKYYKAFKNLGDIFLETGDYDNAIKSLKASIELKDDYGTAYHSLGNVYIEKKEYVRAVENFTKAVEFQPKKHISWFRLAQAHNRNNNCGEAKKAALEATILKKSYGGGWFELALAEYCDGKGNKSTARRYFETARNDLKWRDQAKYGLLHLETPERWTMEGLIGEE